MYCSNCGNKLEEGLDKCPNCGEVVNDIENVKGKSSIKRFNIIIVIGTVIILVLLLGLRLSFLGKSKEQIRQNNQAYLDYILGLDTYALSDDNSRFCVYDFNNDGLNEVVLDIYEHEYDETNTLYVLYRYKDDVLKLVQETDGDFEFYPKGRLFYIMRNGLFSYYIDFDHKDVNWICKEIEGYYDGYSNKYLIGNNEINKDEYDAYVEELVGDKDVMYSEDFKWYDFTRKNLKEVLETK